MQLEFLNQLSQEQIIDLINYVNKAHNAEFTPVAISAEIYNEQNRCDQNGDQEVYLNAWNGNFHVGSYFVKDFSMSMIMPGRPIPLDQELREYMTQSFGEEYLAGLNNYYSILASKECTRLKSFIGVER